MGKFNGTVMIPYSRYIILPEQDPVFLCLNFPDPVIDVLFDAIADTRRAHMTAEYRQWDAPPLPLSKTHH